ncbi:Pepco domain-containing protein [Dapis sp. BLCC M126]|uniref:Pepco domain-containing protein n=1 Tax=Dapis sp. BLCC M126 TaxID=3400189 RepID=UPI003CF0D121
MSEDTIRVITYSNIDTPTTAKKEGSKSIDAGGMPFFGYETQEPSESSNEKGKKGIGEFEVRVDTLETEMERLINIVERLLTRTEKQAQATEIQLDEIELSVEVNAEGKVSILGTGAVAGGKGGITLKFKRQQIRKDG